MVLQPDGKIVAVGSTGAPSTGLDFVVVRYDQDGTLDSSFGNGGIATANFTSTYVNQTANGNDQANAVAIDPKGNIVVAGTTTNAGGGTNIALARSSPMERSTPASERAARSKPRWFPSETIRRRRWP
ncbi:MAG TPA: delta-60 repeat domain-containing protein [Pirellulales bacterium]|nr:delta-60 repeat domain-containing protein [Pirellulales bacterium]